PSRPGRSRSSSSGPSPVGKLSEIFVAIPFSSKSSSRWTHARENIITVLNSSSRAACSPSVGEDLVDAECHSPAHESFWWTQQSVEASGDGPDYQMLFRKLINEMS